MTPNDEPLGGRSNYAGAGLDRDDLQHDPVAQLRAWIAAAIDACAPEPLAAALATASATGEPSVRMILVRGIDDAGLDFYTNHLSRKGRDLAANPRAALTMWWPTLERQVRCSGPVAPLDPAASAAYFATRPRESQLGAWASAQGETIATRADLEALLAAAAAAHPEGGAAAPPIPLPPHWGGYRLSPDRWEFWQGGRHRLHDRFEYQRPAPNAPWEIRRLQP